MLETQKWLIEHNFDYDLLKEKFGIKANHHPTDNRVILNYDQIGSYKQKENNIVRECRGLVLDSKTGTLIARSFYRFFNLNETKEEFAWQDKFFMEI